MHPYPYCTANTSKERSRAEFSGTDALQVSRSQLHPAVCFCLCLSISLLLRCSSQQLLFGEFLVSGRLWENWETGTCGGLMAFSWLFLAAVVRNVLWSSEWRGNRKHQKTQPGQPQGALSSVPVFSQEGLGLIFLLHSPNHVTVFIRFLEFSNSWEI